MRNTVLVSPSSHPRYTHRVRYPGPDGKRLDRFFGNLTDAEAFANRQRKETGTMGTDFGSISEAERAALAFWREFSRTSPTPPDLLGVMQNFRTSWQAQVSSVTVSDAAKIFTAHHAAAGSGAAHVSTLKARIGRFAQDHGNRLMSAITGPMFTEWLHALSTAKLGMTPHPVSHVTRHNLTRSLKTFFEFGVERGWTVTNPIPKAKRSKTKTAKLAIHKAPAILLPADVARLMSALQTEAPKLVPFWAIKFFAGIRDAEAGRLDWSNIDLDGGKIHIDAAISKTSDDRTVKIEPNLMEWLRPHAAASGPVVASFNSRQCGFARAVASLAIRDDSGKVIKAFVFPSNAARHSFGTYHLFHFRDAGETALQMGHKSNPAMLWKHYANRTAEKHAGTFWQILPTAPPNVIGMTAGTITAPEAATPATAKRRAKKA